MPNQASDLHVSPQSHLQGVVPLPPDKSILHRALIMAALDEGESFINAENPAIDNLSTVSVLKQLGVKIEQTSNGFKVIGLGKLGLKPSSTPLDCGNSGTTMRLMAGVLAAQSFESVLMGDESLNKRPMQRIIDPLKQMGADISAAKGHAPIHIKPVSSLKNIDYVLPVASAQVKSALQLAGFVSGAIVNVEEPIPVRDHTTRILDAWQQRVPNAPINIPGDFSAAAFFMAGAVMAKRSDVTLKNVGVNPTRSAMLKYLILMGAHVSLSNHQWFGHEPVADIHIKQAKYLQAIKILPQDIPNLIDELPALFLVASVAHGTSVFPNLSELRVKESDRLSAMLKALKAMGVETTLDNETLSITGQPTLGPLQMDPQGDHRIIMTLAMAAIRATGPIHLMRAEGFKISHPQFISACRGIGVRIKQEAPAYA